MVYNKKHEMKQSEVEWPTIPKIKIGLWMLEIGYRNKM
jgi:hypothetical protein